MVSIVDLEEAKAAREYFRKPFKMSQAPGYRSHKPHEDYTRVPHKKYKPRSDLRRVLMFLFWFLVVGIGFALLRYIPLIAAFIIAGSVFACIVALMPDEYDGGSYH